MTETVDLRGADWLKHGEAARLLAVLNGDGEEARAVGGAVRNALMHLPVGEIDIATTAIPEEVVRRVVGGWLEGDPDRYRARHRDCRHRRQAF